MLSSVASAPPTRITSGPVHEMIRRGYENGDLYQGTHEGWSCHNEGFRASSELVEEATGVHCANHPGLELQWLTERNWFFRLSAYQQRLDRCYAGHPDWVEPEYPRNEMLGPDRIFRDETGGRAA